MSFLFNEILYRPFFNALVFLYQYLSFHDFGIAIILLTILIRLILFPLFYKGAKDQTILQRLAPRIKEIQENHKDDKEKQTRAMLELYREHKVNPFSGFLLLLVQLPVLIALYKVFLAGFSQKTLVALYPFIHAPQVFNFHFLGLVDLSRLNAIIIFLAGLAQYFQTKLALPKSTKSFKDLSAAERMGRQMLYLGPIMTIVFLYFLNLPSAVGLYWLTTSVFSAIQQVMINKKINGPNYGTANK